MGSTCGRLETICGDTGFHSGDRFLLQVAYAPIEASLGSVLGGLLHGELVEVKEIIPAPPPDILGARYIDPMDAPTTLRASSREGPMRRSAKLTWPKSYRFSRYHRTWEARVESKKKGAGVSKFMLQMAADPEERVEENARRDVDDSRWAAAYACKFNTQKIAGDNVMVKVAAPVACEVVDSAFPAMISIGDFVTLTPWEDLSDIEKFVFDGTERHIEVPHAFFHYVGYISGGKELVCDIMGTQDEEGNFILVDPVILGKGAGGVKEVINQGPAAALKGATSGPDGQFEILHPRCNGLCNAFDKVRDTAKTTKAGAARGLLGGCVSACGL